MDKKNAGAREDRIRERAYAIWRKAGEPDGQHREHWAKACDEIDEEDGQIEIHNTPVSSAALPTAEEFATPAEKNPKTMTKPGNGTAAPVPGRNKTFANGRMARGA